jgi:hypothetical protein
MFSFRRAVAVVAFAAGLVVAVAGQRPPGTTTRVSVGTDGTQGNADSNLAAVNADGTIIAFQSNASNLVAGDNNGQSDIFVRDRISGTTTRVSVATNGAEGNAGSYGAAISGDGRYVAFYSNASNLVAGDTNFVADIFVHDRVSGETTRVSVASNGTQGNGYSYNPSLSADGRYVAFESDSSNLVAGDTNTSRDIFVRDRIASTTTRVSVATGGGQANGLSGYAAISANGESVAFLSAASNLVDGDTNAQNDIFVHDRTPGTTTRVSVASSGTQGNAGARERTAISANGRIVGFQSEASNLVTGDTNDFADIFVRDRDTDTTTRVSVATNGAQAAGMSYYVAISADGQAVAFGSAANNLVTGDTNSTWDVFVRDRAAGTTSRVSVATGGIQANDRSSYSAISGDGVYVAFASYATNLVAGDTNSAVDIFVNGAAAPPTVSGIVPPQGSTAGGTGVTITGTGFATGAAVTLGGLAATAVSVQNDTTITATTPAHAAGAVDVVVTNPDTQHGTQAGGFTYVTCAFTIDPVATNPGAAGGPGSVEVTANSADCGWTAVSHDAWVVVSPGTASGTGNGTVSYTVAANASNQGRTGTVTIGGQTLTVQQSAANALPGPPSGLTGSSTGSSVSLSWNAPSSGGFPTAYTIEAGSGPGLSNLANFSTGNTNTTFSAGGVANGLYYLRVRATNGAGTSATSNEVQVRVGPAPPNAPTGLTASAVASNITLSWTTPVGGGAPDGYLIEAGSAPGLSNLANVATGNTLTVFTASGVANGTYYVRVRASNSAGTSGPSNEAVMVVGPATPGAPSGLAWSSAGSTMSLAWTAPATGGPPATYTIEAGSGPGLSNLASFSTGNTATSYAASGIGNGTYFVRVRAANSGGTSGPSNEVPLVVGCTAAAGAAAGLHTNINSGGTVQFEWIAPNFAGTSNGPTTYLLEAGAAPGQSNLAVVDLAGPATTVTFTGIGPGTYYVRVKAKNLCGTGSASNEFTLIAP